MGNDNQTINVVRLGAVRVPFAIGFFITLIALVIICEWTFGIRVVAQLSPTDSSMKINTSIVFLLFGLSLLLQQSEKVFVQTIARAATAGGMIISALTFSQYLFHYNLGIDELLFRDHPNPDITSSPGRMSPLVAFNFLLSGTALLFWRKNVGNSIRPAEYLGIAGLFIPFIVTLGYLFSASSLYSFTTVTGVAFITAILFLILQTGILAVQSECGIITILLSQTRGGFVLRFLLPSSLIVIVLVDWISLKAARAGIIPENLVVPLGTIASGSIIAVLIWRSAKLLYEADIKEKQSFAEMQTAYKMAEEANRAKDEFISVVSHELRTPLNAILGWLQIIKTNPGEENMRRAFEIIGRQSETQLRLVEDLLDTSRIISGKMRLEIKSLQIENVIAEAIESVNPAAAAKNIELTVENYFEGKTLRGDSDRLQQVFWNLLSNAVKFTPQNGAIKIHLQPENSLVQIKFTDTGEGIEADLLPFVFDRFRQSENSKSGRTGGLGLGLSVARSIVELHGGSITASSDGIGKGATFTVHLPIKETS
ncbi:MAG: HAMP domain-containing sensor histidine kinase [Actinomycetota bacterium]